MQNYSLVMIPAAFLTLGAITYLIKSTRSWKARLSSLTGSAALACGGWLFGGFVYFLATNSATNGFEPGLYAAIPWITGGISGIGYGLQPKRQTAE